MDSLLLSQRQREAAFITAYNPLSRPMPPGWNLRMQQRLMDSVRGRPAFPASGRWRRWCESHLVVLGPARPVAVLARRFRQHGIVIIRRGQPARLIQTSVCD
jgi:hypothetical protein